MERVPLDQSTLKALAGETRVRILKLLDARARTQSEIAYELHMREPTVAEHLASLLNADLVVREQTERKWKYYSLTQKARLLLHPNTTTIWFVLGVFLLSAAATVFNAVKYFTPVADVAQAKMLAAPEAESLSLAAPTLAATVQSASPVLLLAFGAITLVLLVALVRILHRYGWLGKSLSNKKNI